MLSEVSLPPLETARIEAELRELAAHLDAATHRLLSLIRTYDQSGAWAGAGLRSCAHWLSWKCGLSPGAARERVRVARALGSLPRIDSMLATGELSFSKVRALTRVANPDNEEKLAAAAKAATAAQPERVCRGIAQVNRDPKAPSSTMDRWVFQKRGDGGMVRIEAQLHPDEAALVMNALDALRPWPQRACANRDVPAETRGVSGDPPAETREPDVAVTTTTHVRVERPSRADALVKLAERVLAPGGAAKDVATSLEPNRTGGDRATLFVHLAHDDLVSLRTATLDDGTRVSAETLRRIACDAGLVPVLTDDDGQLLDVGRKTRSIPPAIRRALIVRDKCCRFPGCDHTRQRTGTIFVIRNSRCGLRLARLLARENGDDLHQGESGDDLRHSGQNEGQNGDDLHQFVILAAA